MLTPTVIAPMDLINPLVEIRARLLGLVLDLNESQLIGPQLDIVNPPLWEIGHAAWFQENWLARFCDNRKPVRDDVDSFYDSAAVVHDRRWLLKLPDWDETFLYMEQTIRINLVCLMGAGPDPKFTHFALLCLFHEMMHCEALTYTRQTLSYAFPSILYQNPSYLGKEPHLISRPLGDAEVPGGRFEPGGNPENGFVFDNEMGAQPIDVPSFSIARAAVSNHEYLRFVEEAGYIQPAFWCADGWRWREANQATHPVYWRREPDGNWSRRFFENWFPLMRSHAVIHVNWFEASAYCRWANRRLPSELEWEVAAAGVPLAGGQALSDQKRRYPWGDQEPDLTQANLAPSGLDTTPVDALPAGESAFGCRQMIGNVWEWTSSLFEPYPGFEAGPYKDYSVPWFGSHRVLRGGCWATHMKLIRNSWRNYYTPDRRDVYAGFRTCPL